VPLTLYGLLGCFEVLIIMVANLPIVTSLSDIMFIGLLFCLMLLLSLRFELVTFNCFLLFFSYFLFLFSLG